MLSGDMAVKHSRIMPALLTASALLAAVVATRAAEPPAATRPGVGPAAIVRLDGQIDDYTRDQFRMRFDRARAAGATTVVVEIDTYGGLVTAGLDLSRYLKNQRGVRTIAFVNDKAISAGAMIALACDEIVMAPSATLGDCAPIQVAAGSGTLTMGAAERAKVESPILADFDESARRHGYDPLLARAMVSAPVVVHWVQGPAGDRRFVDPAERERLAGQSPPWVPVAGEPDPIDGAGSLLTVHTEQAMKLGLAAGRATSAEELAAGRGLAVVGRYEGGAGDGLVSLLTTPTARFLLLIVFVNSLLIALKTPGTGAAEAVAVLALGMLVGLPLLTGHAEWWEVGAILVGLGLILFEVFVFPGHLVSVVLGTAMLLGGLVLTFAPGGWGAADSWAGLERGLQVTVLGLATSLAVFAAVRRYLFRLPMFNRIILTDAAADPRPAAVAEPDVWPFLGTIGVAVSDLKPGGPVRFPFGGDAQVASVVSDGGYVPAGAKVVVREVRGNHVVVRPVAV